MIKPKIFLCILIVFLLPSALYSEERVRVAVMDFAAGDDESTGASISDLLSSELVKTQRFEVLTRSNIRPILEEHNFQLSGLTSEENAARVGELANADYVITGNVSTLGSINVLTAQMIGVNSGQIVSSADVRYSYVEELVDHMENLAGELVATLEGTEFKPRETGVASDLRRAERMKTIGVISWGTSIVTGTFWSVAAVLNGPVGGWGLPPLIATVVLAPTGVVLHFVGNNRIRQIERSYSVSVAPAIVPTAGELNPGVVLRFEY